MKVRTGFVSNSSSSSFIVFAKSTKEIATKMMKYLIKEYDEEDSEFFKHKKKECFVELLPQTILLLQIQILLPLHQ